MVHARSRSRLHSVHRSWRLLDGLFPVQTCNGQRQRYQRKSKVAASLRHSTADSRRRMIAFFGAESSATGSRTRRTQYHYQVLLSPSGCIRHCALMILLAGSPGRAPSESPVPPSGLTDGQPRVGPGMRGDIARWLGVLHVADDLVDATVITTLLG